MPLAYYLVAYAGLGTAMLVLAANPAMPGASFYQPRFIALVHLLTLAWLTGSIFGSFYIVGPLALRIAMPARRGDWIAFTAFVTGLAGMVAHFWINTYDGMAWSAVLVISAAAWVGARVVGGLRASPVPRGVTLHIVLAFVNLLAAAAVGIMLGLDRSRGFLTVSPLALMFAHLHLAAVGWVMMLVIGLAYRLIPMILPAQMASGRSIALSAVLLEIGLAVLTASLVFYPPAAWLGAISIASGVASFIAHVRGMVTRRMPRPPALPARDWSTWQVHFALGWLLVAAACGLVLATVAPGEHRLTLMWVYGVAGLLGFLGQMVAGMQGRLVPLYAWYRAYARTGAPPLRAANALPSAPFARLIFVCWTIGVPLLTWGLASAHLIAIRSGAAVLLAGIITGALYVIYLLRAAAAS